MAEKTVSPTFIQAIGRRKCAVAQVRLFPKGSGKVSVNDVVNADDNAIFLNPLKLIGKLGAVDLTVHVAGGGTHGQLEAIQHGVARALVALDEDLRITLRKSGFLTRDPRVRERKKPGLKSARRAPQWSKR